jgi:hypothetical protein
MADIQKPSGSAEIDVAQVFRWIGNGIRNFANHTVNSIARLRQIFFENKIYFAIVILSGLVMGGLYYRVLSKKYYKSTMILSCDYLNRQIVENTVNKLTLLCEEEAREGLAQELKLDPATAMNIRRFETKSFISETDIVELEILKEQLGNVGGEKKDLVKKVISKIEIENKSAFQISVLIYNPDIIKDLDSAMVNYFKNSPYVKKRIEINRANLVAKQKKLIRESKKLDSLKDVLYRNLAAIADQSKQGSNNVILNDKVLADPMNIYNEDIYFYNELQAINTKIYIQPDFEVIDGFTAFKEPESAGLFTILIAAFIVSWVSGYIILGLWKFDRHLADLTTTPK